MIADAVATADGDIPLDVRTAIRDSGIAQGFHEPGGWFVYQIVDSPYLSATLKEVLNDWTFGHIVDAHKRIKFYEIRAEQREAARKTG